MPPLLLSRPQFVTVPANLLGMARCWCASRYQLIFRVVVGKLNFWAARASLTVQVLDLRPGLTAVLRQFERVRALLEPEGLLVVEHGERTHFDAVEGFLEHRQYGQVNFSFFRR